ncbi:MAG: hypothetical protein HZA46_06480 [Planctomycetales bacterium]|nr:hypothetical protein [Planctomycetales bacterium]
MPAKPRPKLPWRKRLTFVGCVVVFLCLVIELGCYLGLSMLTTETVGTIQTARDRVAQEAQATASIEVFHPYLGWVLNPALHPGMDAAGRHFTVNEYGLLDNGSPIRHRDQNKVIVAFAGGSVSWHVSAEGDNVFVQELKKNERFRGKDIEIVRLAMSGYKEPQQLLLLTYLLSLGAEYDILINIDGYNETALHENENANQQVFPPYPRAWWARVERQPDPRTIDLFYRVIVTRQDRQAWAQFCNRLPLQRLNTVNFLWKSGDARYAQRLLADNIALVQERVRHPGYHITGPRQRFAGQPEVRQFLVDYWARSSVTLGRLCHAHAIEYHHVLPPNQYLEGSKPMSFEERQQAIYLEGTGQTAAEMYPTLVAQGKQLVDRGINFHDLSMLFVNVEEPLYVDMCCHYNPTGNELVARAIARHITGLPSDSGEGNP